MAIADLLNNIDESYYSDAFTKAIEDHLTYLRTNGIRATDITNAQCAKYVGDFYGLLVDLQIRKEHHYATLRVNGYLSPADFTGLFNQVLIPDYTFIDRLKNSLENV